MLGWERGEFNEAVADLFGFHAIQMGLPDVDAGEMAKLRTLGQIVDYMNGATRDAKWRETTNEMGEAPVLDVGSKKMTNANSMPNTPTPTKSLTV